MTEKRAHKLLLNVKDLTWGFPKSPSMVFDKFNFSLYEGEFSILRGTSWSWKTVLSKLLSMHYKAHPKSIYHKMDDVVRYSERDIQNYRRNIGLVYQKEHLIKTMSIKDNISYPLQLLWYEQSEIDKKYKEVIKHFDLKSLEGRKVVNLSEWEKQLVAFARAVINNPEFIMLDEPTGNLDTKSMHKLADLLVQANKDWNTILLLTHDEYLIDYIKWKLKSVVVNKM